MTNEPPQGVKANLTGFYKNLKIEEYENFD